MLTMVGEVGDEDGPPTDKVGSIINVGSAIDDDDDDNGSVP